jgi:predicted AlkP superfamily pyrophosphatase or phosphodiesterase
MNISRRSVRTWAIGVAIIVSVATVLVETQQPNAQLLLVLDGLRPDYVTPLVMPRLYALGQRGVVFGAHHSVFPTVTRVNSSSISTGAYPEAHGLLGNTVYSQKTFATKGVDTSNYEELEAMDRAEGALLTAPTLGEALERAGRKLLVVSAGSSGSALLLNHPLHGGAIIHPEFVQPGDLRGRVTLALGPGPAEAVPNQVRNKWAVDAYLMFGLKELKPAVSALWFGDPDATAHQKGIGSETTIQALRYVDAEIGRIEDTLRAQGLLDRTNIIITSDHGFSTHTSELRLGLLVAPFIRMMPDGSPDIVVTEGAINFRGTADPSRVAAIVAALQKRPEVGAIFTRPDSAGSMKGVVPGTLSFNVPRWNHARSAEILVSANWNSETNDAGFPGKTTQTGVAGHGTSSQYDIHNTLIAAGPDFRQHAVSAVPTANVDIAPTLLKLLGVPIPSSMTGRAIEEAFESGPQIASVHVDHIVETAKTADGAYALSAYISIASGRRYFDYTEVRRLPR